MSNREQCVSLINTFDENLLGNILGLLKSIKDITDEAADDIFCNQLYEDYLNDPDPEKDKSIKLSDLANELGIAL